MGKVMLELVNSCWKPKKEQTDMSAFKRTNDPYWRPIPEVEDTKPTNPKDRAATSRLDISLFPETAVVYGALGCTEGDLKYGGYNWRVAGVLASVYYAAARRHMMKWFNGEECDPKTGVPHLASALSCIAIIIDAKEKNMLKDDRPPVNDVSKILDNFEQKVKHLQQLYPEGPERYTEAALVRPLDAVVVGGGNIKWKEEWQDPIAGGTFKAGTVKHDT